MGATFKRRAVASMQALILITTANALSATKKPSTQQPFLYDNAATLADRYADYRRHCDRCVADDAAFATFKSAPAYRDILEHLSEDQGRMYAHFVREAYADLLGEAPLAAAVAAAARVGAPPVIASYDGFDGAVSPTQLRYLKTLGDLRALVGGALAGLRVLEIGGGYGGQAQLALAADDAPAAWRVRDLDCAERLAAKYIDATLPAAAAARFATGAEDEATDLFVSNYALSELPRDVAAEYYALAEAAPFGYVTWNHGIHADAMPSGEFADRIAAARPGATVAVADECPPTAEGNVLITWRPK